MIYDVAIVGGGIVGLATALKILSKKPKTKLILLEKESAIALHQTGHNSGVIHSGLYYKPGSLKATNCIDGYKELLVFLEDNNIPHDLCGKVVVATDRSELSQLDTLYQRGVQNGLQGLKYLSQEALKEKEPHVKGIKALWVPQTGIVDYKEVSDKYIELILGLGGVLKTNFEVENMNSSGKNVLLQNGYSNVETKSVINCAGLYSDKVCKLSQKNLDTKIIPFRGEYYLIKENAKHLVKNLIYPVPDPNFPFLGVHFTRMINGSVEAGPNAVLAFRREGYKKNSIHLGELGETLFWPGFQKVAKKYWKTGMGEMWRSFSKKAFTKALQKLIPEITASNLEPAEAGVRAQACDKKGGLLDDFKIIENRNFIHIINAPSPAATSSLAIGNTVSSLWLKQQSLV